MKTQSIFKGPEARVAGIRAVKRLREKAKMQLEITQSFSEVMCGLITKADRDALAAMKLEELLATLYLELNAFAVVMTSSESKGIPRELI